MKLNFSLKQIWIILILLGVLVPSVSLMIWFGQQEYEDKLNSALDIQHHANISIRDQLTAEVKRIETLLQNKSDPLALFIHDKNNIKDINHLLRLIILRERHVINEVIIVSKDFKIIAAVNDDLKLKKYKNLSDGGVARETLHWNISDMEMSPEVVIPFANKNYIGIPKLHDGRLVFSLAIPIGEPVSAVLISYIDVGKLWLNTSEFSQDHIQQDKAYNYIVDQYGAMLTSVKSKKDKVGDLMTHIPIVRKALERRDWDRKQAYIGIVNETVFGSIVNVPYLNWSLVSEISLSKITQPILSSLTKVFLIIVCFIIVFVYLILKLVKRALLPFDRLCLAMDHLSDGNYNFKLDPSRICEFDKLVFGFNNMLVKRQKAEEEILKAKEKAIYASNAKSDFLSTMSHELRTPMNAILGFSQLVKMKSKDELVKQNAQEIITAGDHLLELINEILDLSIIEAGKLIISLEKQGLNQIVQDSVLLIEPLAQAKSIRIENNINATINHNVYVDAVRLKQVIINLLGNAVKFSENNSFITLSCVVESEGYLRINVSDTGKGIPKDQIQYVFTSFERVKDKSIVEGAGIGLAISRGLVEAMGGTINVESEFGKGSTFWFTVKLA